MVSLIFSKTFQKTLKEIQPHSDNKNESQKNLFSKPPAATGADGKNAWRRSQHGQGRP
jgi:hypothetical protein